MIVVPGYGPPNATWMLIGEAPGETEARMSRPFCGKSGQEQESWLQRYGGTSKSAYMSNVIKEYTSGNPDPTPAQIDFWTPVLIEEIKMVRPKLIVAVGRFAMRWLLGEDAELDACHGMPHCGGAFDATRAHRACGAVVIPIVHVASGFYDLGSRSLIAWDYKQVARAVRLAESGGLDVLKIRRDEYEGREDYRDVTGTQLAEEISNAGHISVVGYDTEGTPEEPWSAQISWRPGQAFVLRCSQTDFHVGVEAMQRLADSGCRWVTHDAGTPRGTGYDYQVSRTFGLELRDAVKGDTMYDAYLLRIEPKGLKALMWRWCGMKSEDYMSLIGNIGRQKQIDYLRKVADDEWPKIDPKVIRESNGTFKVKKFQPAEKRAKAILRDIDKGKVNKAGELTDPRARWNQVEPEVRKVVEGKLGKLPYGTLDDVDLDTAVFYAGRDADATLRLDAALSEERYRMGVDGVYDTGMQVLPIFEEMQHSGMPASRKAFVDLAAQVDAEMYEIQCKISSTWYDGRPFNPGPGAKDVETLVRRLGITGLKKSEKTGRVSTSMKNIEHYAAEYPAIAAVRDWRQRQKVLSTYCLPLIEIADKQNFDITVRRLGDIDGQEEPLGTHLSSLHPLRESGTENDSRRRVRSQEMHSERKDPKAEDIFIVRCNLKPVSVETRRLAAEDPSLLNQPSRTELGRKVRACYMTGYDNMDDPDAEVFGSWDFSAQEVRVAAHVSNDKLLCAIVSDPKRDVHYETASRIFGKPIDQIKKNEERTPAKTAFFGILYGLSGMGLMDQFRTFGLTNWTQNDCDKLIAEVFRVYPGLQAAISAAQEEAKRYGLIRDLYGHIRYLPAIYSGSRKESSEAGRQAFSHRIQGSAQGMTQNAMAWLRKPIRDLQRAGLAVKWALQVHDELIMRMPRWLFPVVDKIMTEGMTKHYGGKQGIRLRVPVLADGHMSTRWDQLK